MIALPRFPDSKNLELEDQLAIDNYFRRLPSYSDHTFSSLYTWNTQNQNQISDLNGNLIIKMNDYLTNQPFLTFLGDRKVVETIEAILCQGPLKLVPRHCLLVPGSDGMQADLPAVLSAQLMQAGLPPFYRLEEDRDNFDYVYDLEDLASLSGNRYRGKRNFVNRFNRLYRWQTAELDIGDDDTWAKMQALYKIWSARQNQKENDVENESRALARLRAVAGRLNLYTLGLFVGTKLVGYTVNEVRQNYEGQPNFTTNLFEHADVSFTGVFPILTQQTAVELLKLGQKHLSHQQDLGLPGLRKSKEDLHPIFFLKKYTIKKIPSA